MRNLFLSKMLLLLMFVASWLTLPLLGKSAVKRFLPASILISLIVRLESAFAKKRRWWWFYERIHPKLSGEFPLIWGPFLIGSMWILKLTYGKFFVYMVTNFITDTVFSYPVVTLCKKLGVFSLVRLKKFQLSLLFLSKSILLYGFQYCRDKIVGEGIVTK